MAISGGTRKTLWTRARNECAFPGCLQTLTEDVSDAQSNVSKIVVVGEEAHIRARSVGGPRYDADYSDVDEYENLVLMCPTHHTKIDANNGSGYAVKTLLKMKADHERNQVLREELQATLRAYLGDRYAAENTVQFQQVDLRGPSVDTMFVDVPVGVRRNGSTLTAFFEDIAETAPGDTDELERSSGFVVTGATQALLHPDWEGNAVLVGGPGQGKSTVLQYVCQFHRARRLGHSAYTAGQSELARANSKARFPVRIDLRKYAQRAASDVNAPRGKKRKKTRLPVGGGEEWLSLEEYIIEDMRSHIGAHDFTPKDFVVLLATEPVLFALDGLDEVASLPARARVVEEIIRMRGRLSPDAADLVILIATRPGTSLQPLTATGAFPLLHLQRLTQGLRLQYLRQWVEVSGLSPAAAEKLQTAFMDSQNVPHISELASYPMQLAILLHLLHRRQLLPQQRTELYAEYLKTFLDREQTEDKEPLLADQRRVVEDTHAYLGWHLQTKAEQGESAGSITREELRQLLRSYLAGQPEEQQLAEELYSAITDRVLCLVERDEAFEFEVQSLREYFAALHIFENLTPKGQGNSRDDGLNALLERPYWANVCRFFIGKLTKGELRGLYGNLHAVQKKIAPHPQVRAMAVTVLNDRIYDGLTNVEIGEVVDFVLDGPGVVLAEDGVIDSAGSPLRLGERAGRAQAVAHLKERLCKEQSLEMSGLIAQSLTAHAVPADDLSSWWWGKFEPTAAWLTIAARLSVFVSLTPERAAQLHTLATEVAEPHLWCTELLLTGGYEGRDDGVMKRVLEDLNEGAAELPTRHGAQTDLEVLITSASTVLGGPYEASVSSRQAALEMRSPTADRMERATNVLRDTSVPESSLSGWIHYLSVVAEAWGDGWVLRRAISMIPSTIDLSTVAIRSQAAALTNAAQTEADYRAKKADTEWWRTHLTSTTTPPASMLAIVALLKHARTAVIVELAQVLDHVVGELDPKRYRVVERALQRDAESRSSRPLDMQEALRLRRVSLEGRTLWLVYIIATDSTRGRLPVHLEPEIQDVLHAGTVDGRVPLTAARTSKKLKLELLRSTREALPLGGWATPTRLGSLTLKLAKEILEEPVSWPADLVQLATDRVGTQAATRTPPLAEVAAKDRWFRN